MKRPERLQAGIDVIVRVNVFPFVERQSADHAQPRTVLPIERRDRQGQQDGLADRLLEIELVVGRQVDDAELLVFRADRQRAAAVDVDRRQRLVVDLEREGDGDVPEAPCALGREARREVGIDEQPAIGSTEMDPAFDRRGEGEVLAAIDAELAK